MEAMRAENAAAAVGGRVVGDGEVGFSGAAADSRKVRSGDLFVALPGERVDGHHYVPAAFAAGATVALVTREPETIPAGKAAIVVPDAGQALIELGKWRYAQNPVPVIGVTGSIGKTTTKDLISSALAGAMKVLSNLGNLNSDIGLPLTLLRLQPDHEVAVLEMGMRGKGQIAQLCGIVRPKIGVITNIMEVHLEILGSLENITAAKAELLEALPADGTAVLNADDPRVRALAGRYGGMTIMYGTEAMADVRAIDITTKPTGSTFEAVISDRLGGGRLPVALPVPGRHNVLNSVAAIAVGLALGVPLTKLREGLGDAHTSGMRLETFTAGDITVINDAYNASPASMRAALAVLRDLAAGRKIAVLGNMLELGPLSREWHRDLGAAVVEAGCDLLITVGDLAAFIGEGARAAGLASEALIECVDNAGAVTALNERLTAGDTVLVKGSRGMAMEEIAAILKKR